MRADPPKSVLEQGSYSPYDGENHKEGIYLTVGKYTEWERIAALDACDIATFSGVTWRAHPENCEALESGQLCLRHVVATFLALTEPPLTLLKKGVAN